MRNGFWGVLAGTIGMVMAGGVSAEAGEAVLVPESARASIVVRTYTRPASEAHMPVARRTASAALDGAGIQVVWVECGVGAAQGAPDLCTEPLRRHELVVRLVSAGTQGGRSHGNSLGFAFVDLHSGGGSLATVYADRVEGMAQLAGVGVAELLGRAMAHEIGHLLLGTNRHAAHGLMRASWSGADLRRDRATQWLFGGKEGDEMRRRIASRPGS